VELRYLYIGSADTGRDVDAWLGVPGAGLRWRFRAFGADVAAVDLGSRPTVLVADHRPAGTVLPIYSVDDLDTAVAGLAGEGWTVETGPLGTPEGPATLVRAPGGAEIALLRVDRPGAMDSAYTDAGNRHAVRSAYGG
jgi:hypothetical protein